MRHEIFTIYDKVSKSFGPLFTAANPAVAVRQLRDVISDPNSSIARYPDDYCLYSIGYFNNTLDEEAGIVDVLLPFTTPTLIIEASSLMDIASKESLDEKPKKA